MPIERIPKTVREFQAYRATKDRKTKEKMEGQKMERRKQARSPKASKKKIREEDVYTLFQMNPIYRILNLLLVHVSSVLVFLSLLDTRII